MSGRGRCCPSCGGKKGFYARSCRPCSPKQTPLAGRRGPDHPAWKGGAIIDRDGYVRTYAPDHPWPRKNGYLPEHVRVVELALGRRLLPHETVHHRDHSRQNNELVNLEVIPRGDHSRLHRRIDIGQRKRTNGRFA